MEHWKEDFMFGYQFLNGCNPVLIEKCKKLPDKFPVTHEMVAVSLERELTLEQEIEVHMCCVCFSESAVLVSVEEKKKTLSGVF